MRSESALLFSLLFLVGCDTTIGDCVDADGDGVGVGAACEQVDCDDDDPSVQVCGSDRPEDADVDADGYTAEEDCNDTDPAVHPGAGELCNGVDEDCDGETDEDATDAGSWYADTDGDGFGDPDAATAACSAPAGTVADDTDCDDALSTVFPGADELCNTIDDDCDSEVDEDGTNPGTWYADTDQDGFGDPNTASVSCSAPAGTVADNTDCDDALSTVFPGADELCNTIDDDCDTEVDEEATDATVWFADTDQDGFGDPNTSAPACSEPSGWVLDDTDCDDAIATVFPGADELCNNLDDDCDSELDEDPTDATLWFADSDNDTFGEQNNGLEACTAPSGFVADNTDCDDSLDSTFPGADELCNNLDDDCDSEFDEDPTDATFWFADTDGDGFGTPDSGVQACEAPTGSVLDNTDCDDNQVLVFPDAEELCNSIDDDCDTEVDEDATGATATFLDADGDGFGDPNVELASCEPLDGYSLTNDDCDDSDPNQSPASRDYPGDGVDSDCDGEDLPDPDAPNVFYVSPALGSDLPDHGTRNNPFATITYAVSQSSTDDWLMLDAATYTEAIRAPRNVVGSFNALDNWTLNLSDRSSIIRQPAATAWSTTLQPGATASLSGVTISGMGSGFDLAVHATGTATSRLLLHNVTIEGAVSVTGASVELMDCDGTSENFGLYLREGNGHSATVTNSRIHGDTGGAWIQSHAVLTDSTFSGSIGLFLSPDQDRATATFTRVRSEGSNSSATLISMDATITDSTFVSTLESSSTSVALRLANASDATIDRSRIVLGDPSAPTSASAFFMGVEVDDSSLILANSVVETWADGESNSHAYGIQARNNSSVTLVNSTLLTDVREGNLTTGLQVIDQSNLIAINTALHNRSNTFQSNRGLWVIDVTPTTLAGVAFSDGTDPLVFVQNDSSVFTQTDLAACSWGSCQSADAVLFEDLQLTDPSTGDVTPTSSSPLKNAGVDALSVAPSLDPGLLTHDFTGAPRGTDGTWDIGAYEID